MADAMALLPLVSLAALSEGLRLLISLLLVILAVLILKGVFETSILGDGPGEDGEKTHCGHCGAYVDADQSTCAHCGEAITGEN